MNPTIPRNLVRGLVSFACASFLATAGAATALAQAVPTPKSEKAAEPAVELSPFVVKEEVTDSYQARQTVVGSRTAKDLVSMPTSITVITAQQIKDLNAVEVSQVLAVGVSGVTRNQTINDDVNIRDWQDVIWAITTRVDPVRDTVLVDQTPIDYLDFASPVSGLGGKMGLDATSKWPGETQREWGRVITMPPQVQARADAVFAELFGSPANKS